MFFVHMIHPIPAKELDEGEVACVACKKSADEIVDVDGKWHCEKCAEVEAEAIAKEADVNALESCRITREFQKYDSRQEFKVTPQEFEAGDKGSYSPNAFRTHFRHNCTNYEELIKSLDRDSFSDQI